MNAPTPHPSTQRWSLLLDGYEATLDEHRRHLTSTAEAVGDRERPSPPPPFAPPADLGPLPAELAERAQRLVDTTRELALVARELLAELPPTQPVRPNFPTARPAARFDRGL